MGKTLVISWFCSILLDKVTQLPNSWSCLGDTMSTLLYLYLFQEQVLLPTPNLPYAVLHCDAREDLAERRALSSKDLDSGFVCESKSTVD